MKRCVAIFVFSIMAMIFYYEYNFNDFMIEMGLRAKCGEEYITDNSSFIKKISYLRRMSHEESKSSMIKRYVVNLREWKNSSDVKDYLIENGFDCTVNEGRNCILQQDLYSIQDRQCATKKHADLIVYKHRMKINLLFPNDNVNDIVVGYDFSNIKN